MHNKGHFETSEYHLPDGSVSSFPIYLGDRGEKLPETETLLDAVKIINGTLNKDGYPTLEQLVNEVGRIIAGSEIMEGILIEDEEDLSAVRVTHQETTVSQRSKGISILPSSLMFDALYKWNQISKKIY